MLGFMLHGQQVYYHECCFSFQYCSYSYSFIATLLYDRATCIIFLFCFLFFLTLNRQQLQLLVLIRNSKPKNRRRIQYLRKKFFFVLLLRERTLHDIEAPKKKKKKFCLKFFTFSICPQSKLFLGERFQLLSQVKEMKQVFAVKLKARECIQF